MILDDQSVKIVFSKMDIKKLFRHLSDISNRQKIADRKTLDDIVDRIGDKFLLMKRLNLKASS